MNFINGGWRVAPIAVLFVRLIPRFCLLLACTGVPFALGRAASYHVSPTGLQSGQGTITSPWDLRTALTSTNVMPGDSVWLHQGDYEIAGRPLVCVLRGDWKRPIIVRNYNGARVRIYNRDLQDLLVVNSNYVWFWGIEFTNTYSTPGPSDYGGTLVTFGGSDRPRTEGNKLINCVLHDAMVCGVADWTESSGTEIYGCVLYFNGRKNSNDNYGYGIYAQNNGPVKSYEDNVFFSNFGGYQIHLYAEKARVDSFRIAHNVVTGGPYPACVVVSASGGVRGIVLDSNYFYGPSRDQVLFRERKGLESPKIRGNYFLRGRIAFRGSTVDRVFSGNVLDGGMPTISLPGREETEWREYLNFTSSNDWRFSGPGNSSIHLDRLIVRRNRFDPNRTHIICYNGSGRDSIRVHADSILRRGQQYKLLDALRQYETPLLTGTFTGGSIYVPMSQTRIPSPVSVPMGLKPPDPWESSFRAFVLISN